MDICGFDGEEKYKVINIDEIFMIASCNLETDFRIDSLA